MGSNLIAIARQAASVIAAVVVMGGVTVPAGEIPGGTHRPPRQRPRITLPASIAKGAGDVPLLRLLDESFAFFHANSAVPNLTMVYQPDWDAFVEGANWRYWWTQNSYGFSYAATPFLQEPWFSILQRSWDLFWDQQADGKRRGGHGGYPGLGELVGPDGCLGNHAGPKFTDFIAHRPKSTVCLMKIQNRQGETGRLKAG